MQRTLCLITAVLLLVWIPAAAQAQASFDQWVKDFWPVAKSEGISTATYERAFRGVTPDPEVLEKAKYQPEFVKPLWDYIRHGASETRVTTGRELLARHASLLDRIEQAYGVDRHIVVAIWGLESTYGEVLDDPKIVRSVVRSLATLAWGDPRRARFGRQQLLAALKIIQNGDIPADALTGSWAGAMGHTQFIPTTYQAYAVDFDGDGRRDMWNGPVDALASTASYLNESGWVAGRTWGYEVVLPPDFDYRLADVETSQALAVWDRLGVRRAGGKAYPRAEDNAVLLAPAGASGPAFLLLRNHYVIKRYNNATAYALAVGHLADRLRGGEPFLQAWPASDRPLSKDETAELQGHLQRVGLYQGIIDGKIGPRSRAAIRAFQAGRGMAPDGFAGVELLEALRSG